MFAVPPKMAIAVIRQLFHSTGAGIKAYVRVDEEKRVSDWLDEGPGPPVGGLKLGTATLGL